MMRNPWCVMCDVRCVMRNALYVIREPVWCDFLLVGWAMWCTCCCTRICAQTFAVRRKEGRHEEVSIVLFFHLAPAFLRWPLVNVHVTRYEMLQCVWALRCCRQETPAIVPRENESSNVCSEWNSLEGRRPQNSYCSSVSSADIKEMFMKRDLWMKL